MFRFIKRVIGTVLAALMLGLSIPASQSYLIDISKVNKDNKIVKWFIEFIDVYDKYNASNAVNYYYFGIAIIGAALLFEFIGIFTKKKFINFLAWLLFLVAFVAFIALFTYAKFKLN
ncbi:MAG: hypothetical protein K6G28_06540 [Acholeplasmatales bacterium]|nr:hypothetical protein [Acholeplasmatales bacterium]